MPRTRSLLLALCLSLSPLAAKAEGQQRVATITTVVTTQTVSTFQLALPSASRNSCTVQYNGAGVGFVYFGTVASATVANAFQLANKQSILCAVSSLTLTDAVNVTSSATSDGWVLTTQ